MTKDTHVSGTDRCYEATLSQPENSFDYVINIQGDEPLIHPEQIDLLAGMLDGSTEIATLVKAIDDAVILFNPNVVKAVISASGNALFFSRSTIPHVRGADANAWMERHTFFKHIGMYAYRKDVLEKITRLPVSSLEKAESLEQLRWLENGFSVKTAETQLETLGIDTPEDLLKAIEQLRHVS